MTIGIDDEQFRQEFNENQPVPRIISPGGVIFVGGMANVRKHTNGQSTDNLDGQVRTVSTCMEVARVRTEAMTQKPHQFLLSAGRTLRLYLDNLSQSYQSPCFYALRAASLNATVSWQIRVNGNSLRHHLDLAGYYHESPRPSWVIINGDFPREPPVPGNNGVFFSRPNEDSLRLPKWEGQKLQFKFRFAITNLIIFLL